MSSFARTASRTSLDEPTSSQFETLEEDRGFETNVDAEEGVGFAKPPAVPIEQLSELQLLNA